MPQTGWINIAISGKNASIVSTIIYSNYRKRKSTMMTKNETTTLATPSDREIVITHVFNAPRQLVYDTWTKPEHIKHWYGPAQYTMSVCDMDLRVGGRWRFVLRSEQGEEFGFGGEIKELVPPERMVSTEGFEG